jgi:hypothetical protein
VLQRRSSVAGLTQWLTASLATKAGSGGVGSNREGCCNLAVRGCLLVEEDCCLAAHLGGYLYSSTRISLIQYMENGQSFL